MAEKYALGLILLLSLLLVPISPVAATPDEVKWSRVNIPTEGKPGNWVLASDSDVQHLTMAIDGSLYCYAKVSSDNVLFKSNDDGRSWDTPDKTPPGDGPTYVVMADDFADSGKAYATTSGAGSAFSITQLVTMPYPALPGSVI